MDDYLTKGLNWEVLKLRGLKWKIVKLKRWILHFGLKNIKKKGQKVTWEKEKKKKKNRVHYYTWEKKKYVKKKGSNLAGSGSNI